MSFIESIENFDTNLFKEINSCHSVFWDDVMYFVSGTFSWAPLYAFVIYLIIRKYGRNSIWAILLMILGVVIADQLSVHLFKNVFERFRPCQNLELKETVHLVNGKCGGLYGFISSHAANTFMFALLSSLFLRIRLYWYIIFFWATLVSYSRIYLGVHYPGDVTVGAIFGMAVGLGLYAVWKKWF